MLTRMPCSTTSRRCPTAVSLVVFSLAALVALGCDGEPVQLPERPLPMAETDGPPDPPTDSGPADSGPVDHGPRLADTPAEEVPRPATCGDGVAEPGEFCPAPPEPLSGRVQATRVLALDWSGDRRLDVLATGFEGIVRLWRQTPQRRLLEDTVLEAPLEPIDLAAGDFDGDGDLDIARVGVGDRGLWIDWQRADGFTPGPERALPGTPFGIAAGDLDGDGRDDLAVADFSRGGMTVLLAADDFEPRLWRTGVEPHGITLRDVDGDGHLDGLVANAGRHQADRDDVTVRFGDGAGGFDGRIELTVGNGPFWVDGADLDGDGIVDLVAANYGTPAGAGYEGGDTVSVLRGLGGRRFAAAVDWPTGNGPTHLVLADVDRDGDVDVVTADRGDFDFGARVARGGSTATVLFNDGAAGFARRSTIALPAAPLGVAAADVNGDGSVEILAACLDDWRVYRIGQAP